MNLTVLGLWHLGSVTAACSAKHFPVIGLDFEAANMAGLNHGRAPLFEPGLNELIAAGLAAKRLSFTTDPKIACARADVLWLCYDTPVDDHDEADVESVLANLRRALPHLPDGRPGLDFGAVARRHLPAARNGISPVFFACSPENLRLGRALDAFESAERVVVGIRDETKKALLEKLFAPFTPQVLFMRTESAEMVKHALNSFLALSITYINEIARLCELTGADAKEVSAGLKSEARIGPKAYLVPGGRSRAARWPAMSLRSQNWRAPRAKRSPSFRPSNRATTGIVAGPFTGCSSVWVGCGEKPSPCSAWFIPQIPTHSDAVRRWNCAKNCWRRARGWPRLIRR